MHIAFITMNRFVEEKCATDAEYRKVLEQRGRPLLSHGRALADAALLEKLHRLGLKIDRPRFLALSPQYFSAEDMARAVVKAAPVPIPERQEDWVWIAFTCFWERWQPERPSLEMIDDWMQDGYKLQAKHEEVAACRLWLKTWKEIWKLIESQHLDALRDYDDRFVGTQSVFNWIQDLMLALQNAGVKDPSFWEEQIVILENVLGRLQLEEVLFRNLRNDLATAHFCLGRREQGDALYRQWLTKDPRWGWGWIGWSDCWLPLRPGAGDPTRAEAILREGLAVPDVQDRDYLLERLASLQANATEDDEPKKSPPPSTLPAPRTTPAKPPVESAPRQGGGKLPALDILGQFPAAQRRKAPASGKEKIGRNDPCPCGSGKKFKRCCGR